jgi:hypothetical protein
MPKEPKGQNRPADVIGKAVRVMRIATGEDQAAAELGRKGGRARAEKMTAEQRSAAARKAAAGRWSKRGG